jgi:metal-responsive CopG/Arc/MetJ family transcriptional regulator
MQSTLDEKQMIHMRFDAALLERVDSFRFRHRFESRTAAIEWLVQWALKQKPKPEEK